MIQTVVIGAAGRMGRSLVTQVMNDPDLELSGACEAVGHPLLGADAGATSGSGECGVPIRTIDEGGLSQCDAVIDFTLADAVVSNTQAAVRAGAAVVIGTTGLSGEDEDRLRELADDGGRIVYAPNMSVGVNLLFYLAGLVAEALGSDYDLEVVEAHHNRKKDAPSGTARRLTEILASARQLDVESDVRHGRSGAVGERPGSEIGVHAVRGGDIVGEHTVLYAGPGERIELTHRASSRQTFAKGAVRAVKFAVPAAPGLYDMQDVLGLHGRA